MKKIDRNKAVEILTCSNDLLKMDNQLEEIKFSEDSGSLDKDNTKLLNESSTVKSILPVHVKPDNSQPAAPVVKKQNKFSKKLDEYDLKVDQQGIYKILQGAKVYITNFSQIEFQYRKLIDGVIARVYSFDKIPIELLPGDLQSQSSFSRNLLGCSKFMINLDKYEFPKFIALLLDLDDGKIVEDTIGFGQVTPEIFHFGNKVAVNGKLSNFESPIWIGDHGYYLNRTDMVRVTEDNSEFDNVWKYFHGLYSSQAILILGFAVFTLYSQQYLKAINYLPQLYIQAASGRGKSCLARFICSLFGLNDSLATINCAGNSTKIGIESKSMLLNNLPLVLNEATEENFNFMKSRYDGQGSVKFHRDKPGNILERSVNGTTIATTVVEPFDKQIVSRCVFIDLDHITLNKKLYDKVQSKIEMLSSFATEILQNVSFDDLLEEVDIFTKTLALDLKEPRILVNYCLLAGCFKVFKKLCNDESLPSETQIHDYIIDQMKKAESYLNPLIHFIIELERLADTPAAQSYISQDHDFLYFNFNSVWSAIKDSYKKKHFPFMTAANIKELLKDSDYIAVYGHDLAPKKTEDLNKPIVNYVKKINSISKRCFVVKRSFLPGFYR